MLLRIYERTFVIALFLYAMQVTVGIANPYEGEIDASATSATVHTGSTLIEVALYSFGAILVVLRARRVFDAARAAYPLCILTAFVLLSTLWSDQPMLTLRRAALFAVSSLFAIYLGERYSLEKLSRLLAHTFVIMLLAIAVLYVVAPEYVIDQVSHPGDWKGLSAYKNAFGQYMAIAALLFALIRFRQWDLIRYPLLLCALLFLGRSHSASSRFTFLLMLCVVMPLWAIARRLKVKKALMTRLAIGVLGGAMFMIHQFSSSVIYMLGRNTSLTGRTQLWNAIQLAIMHRPLLGYGYDVFWASRSGEALQVRASAGWMAVTADNGFYDLGLSLGVLGVLLFFLVFLWSLRMAIQQCMASRSSLSLWPVTYLSFFLIHNMSESTLLTRGTLPFLLFGAISTALALEQRRQRIATECSPVRHSAVELPLLCEPEML